MKLTVSKSKNSASFYVQKSIRKPGGGTTTVTIEKLGNIDEVRAKAGGKDPYIWAQEYVNELNRQEYEKKSSIIVSYSPVKLLTKGELKSFNCGYLFLQKVYYSLGLNKICKDISLKHQFHYDLNDILSKLVYNQILFPSSKLTANSQVTNFIEQPTFELHDIYRSLTVLNTECDFIQEELFKNSQKLIKRRKDILYYDCTNFYFEIEEADDLRKYGKSKQHQPLPLVGMGLFMDYDGIPLAFDIYPGNKNEQPTLKPLEEKIIRSYGLEEIIVCTDAGLSSTSNRKFNDCSLWGQRIRSFITTQSIKQLPQNLKEFSLDPSGWRIIGSDKTYNLNELDENLFYDTMFYKEKWIKEDLKKKEEKAGKNALEQHLIVTFSFKYKNYQRKIRQGQIDRAAELIKNGDYKRKTKNQNDPHRFIKEIATTADGEVANLETPYLDQQTIADEEMYDGFYAVCTNMDSSRIEEVININKRRWEIEESFRIMKTEFKGRPVFLQREDRIKAHFLLCFISLFVYRILEKQLGNNYTCSNIIKTLRSMTVYRNKNKQGYLPAYTRTDITDALHENAGFRTDYEILTDISMKRIIRDSKKK